MRSVSSQSSTPVVAPTRQRQTTACRAGHLAEIQPLERRQLLSGLDYYGTVRADGNDAVMDGNGTLHRVWRDTTTGTLKYSSRGRQFSWTAASNVDSRKIGGEISIALDPLGRPSVAYYDRVNGDLWFAQLQDNAWIRTRLDSDGNVGDFPSLIYAQGGRAFISYYDRTNGDLKLAWQSASGSWSNMAIETGSNVGAYSSIAAAPDGLLRIAYSDVLGLRLKYASQNPNGTWSVRSIDKNATAGVRFTSLAINPTTGQPYIAYYDVRKKDLRVATAGDGVVWTSQRVATLGAQGEFANLYFSDGFPTVVYLNRTQGTINEVRLNREDQWDRRVVGIAREHLSVAQSAGGVAYINHSDPRSGLLRTTSAKHDHQHDNFTDPGERIIQWETIGGSNNDDSKRRVGWSIDTQGWQGYVNTRVAQLRALGMKRLFLHNPFGTRSDEPYFQFDQYIHAQEAGLTWLTEGFTQAIKPLVDSGIEVICYIGKLHGDPDFDNLTDLDQYMDRVMRSLRPMIDAGCSIGLDSIVGAENTTRAYMVAEILRNSGIRVYAENRPPKAYTWWHDFGGVYYNEGYVNDTPENNPALFWAAPNSMLRGEKLRYTNKAPPGYGYFQVGWRGAQVISIVADGGTAATDFVTLMAEGMSLQSMIDAAYGSINRPSPLAGSSSAPSTPSPFGANKVDDGIVDDVL